MAAKDRLSVLLAMMEQGVIPVFYDPDVDVCKNVIQACANGGAKCIEFTNRGDFASHVFYEVTRHFAKADPVGDHGRRLRRRRAHRGDLHRQRREVRRRSAAQRRRRQGLQPPRHSRTAPAAARPSEIGYAQELGCEIVKVFPGSSVGGPDFVKSVMAPMPWTRIMPTGGVEATEASLRTWFGAGIVACGIGSNLITKKLLDAKRLQGHRGERAHHRAAREDHQGRPGREALEDIRHGHARDQVRRRRRSGTACRSAK